MKKMMVNGREIKTNYPGGWAGYPMTDGNRKKTMSMHGAKFRESDEEMLKRLAACGYTTITFYEKSTRVKGYHEIIAFCK